MSPHPTSFYNHPSMNGSTSTFKGGASSAVSSATPGPSASTSSLASVTSPSRPPIGPRNPSTLRTSSANSIAQQQSIDAGSTTPTASPAGVTNGAASALAQKTRSRSPMGSIKGDRDRDPKEQRDRSGRDRDGKENKSRRQHQTPGEKVLGSGNDPRTRNKPYPTLPMRDAQPAPATLMYWSRAPVYGAMPASGMRAHSMTLIDSIAWIFGGCDERGCWRDIWCFNTGTRVF